MPIDWTKLFKCPPNKQLQQCLADLGGSNEQLGKAQSENSKLIGNLATCNATLGTWKAQVTSLTQHLQDCQNSSTLAAITKERDDLLALSKLLTEGPEVPDQSKVKWLPQYYIDEILTTQMGEKYTQCPAKHYSESDYLVCSLTEMRRFIDYYAMFWMPHIKYVTQQWKKLDGSQVEVYKNDCDNFSDFFKGEPAINPNWACFPWGQVWADVQGWLSGGHAFNILVCCDDTYSETSRAGLRAYILEPQMAGGGPWPAARPQITGYELKEVVAGYFEIQGAMWMIKF